MRKLLFVMILVVQFSSCEFFNSPINPPVIDSPVIVTGSGGQSSITCAKNVNTSSTGCTEGAGDFETTSFNLSDFENIHLDFCGNIQLKQGAFDVKTTVQSNILPAIDLAVENNTLTIQLKDNSCIAVNEAIIFDISLPIIKEIKNSSSGYIKLLGQWEDIDALSIIAEGAGNFQIEEQWNVQTLRIQQDGVSKVIGFSPIAAETNIELNGIGRVETTTTDKLTGTIYGPGTIYYKGTPTVDVDLLSITSNIIDAN